MRIGTKGSSRRDFIKIAAGSLGGAMLAGGGIGCAGFGGGGGGGRRLGGGVGNATLPNGYIFYRVMTPGTGSSPFPDLTSLSGGVTNNDSIIFFHGLRNTGQNAIYELDMSYNGTNLPTFSDSAVRLSEGDVLGDGNQVDKIHSASINNQGVFSNVAVVIETSGTAYNPVPSSQGTGVVYVDYADGNGLTSFIGLQTPTPNGGTYGAHFGDIAINDNLDVLIVADYTLRSNQTNVLQQGVFLLPGATSPSQGSLLATASSAAPGQTALANRFGLIDMDNQQNYVVQAFGAPSAPGSRNASTFYSSGVLGGRGAGDPQFLVGAPQFGRAVGDTTSGNVYMGPRVTGGNYSAVVHTSDSTTNLVFNDTTVISSGATTPTGDTVGTVGPASVTSDGLIHFLVTTTNGMELIVSNGVESKTVLKNGDMLANSSQPIVAIVHGYHSDQVDTSGRIVFIGEFADQSQSVVVGIPV